MSKDNLPAQQPGPRPVWFIALLLLDAFALGGLVALRIVFNYLESSMGLVITMEAGEEILNELDHLFPYWVGYIGVSLLLVLITVGAALWLKTRSRIVLALTFITPLSLLVLVLALRGFN